MNDIKYNWRVLLVSDDRHVRKGLEQMLKQPQCQMTCLPCSSDVSRIPGLTNFDIIFIDMDHEQSWLKNLKEFRKLAPAARPIVVLDSAHVGAVLKMVNSDIEVAHQRLVSRRLSEKSVKFSIVSHESASMKGLMSLVSKVAPSNTPVLLIGESGSGKDLVARIIHQQSRRSQELFFSINCAGLASTLLESELFGHEKGAFTGADRLHNGLFEVANGGTVFLDEIGDMPLDVQSKLLRVLESGEFRRLGGNANLYTDVRIVAATNMDVKELAKTGRLRQDLVFRINTIVLDIPPLRERREDIKPLAEYFLNILGRDIGKEYSLDPEVLPVLKAYQWPGNVRQLKNTIESLILLAEGPVIRAADLPPWLALPQDQTFENESDTLSEAVVKTEKQHIIKILFKARGNRRRAARLLGLSEPTLYRKLNEYGLANS